MASFSIGEVEKLTNVKQHILRYWEENVPILSPAKDGFGHRIYTSRDVQIIMRLRFLIVERKLSMQEAYNQMLQESTVSEKTVRNINILKDELILLYDLVRKK